MTDNNLKYAGFWIRFASTIIDTILLMAITYPIMYLVYGTSYEYGDGYKPLQIVFEWIIPFVGTIILWKTKSATPGKMMLSLKVVDADTGNPLTTKQSIIRYFAYIVSAIPLFFGFIWIVFDSKKRGLHDIIASSVVISYQRTVEDVTFKENNKDSFNGN